MNPTISVIIPVYNVESYLARCLDSVICNTYSELEIICVNDGSTDGSLRILDEYARKDSRINVYSQSNKGVAAARNKGLDNAHGEWVSFVDADDWLHPQYFEILIQAWKLKGSSAEIVCCHCEMTGEYRIDSRKYSIGEDIVSEFSWPDVSKNLFLCSILWMRIYKRTLFGDFRIPENLVSAEDTAANLVVMGRAPSLNGVQVSLQLYYYYQRDSSAVHTLNVSKKLPALTYIYNELDGFLSMHAKHYTSELLLLYLSYLLLYRDVYSETAYREARDLYWRTLAVWKRTRMHPFSQLSAYAKFMVWHIFPNIHLWYCLRRNPLLKASIQSEAGKRI